MQDAAASGAEADKRIRQLEESVVNKIAAGEVIQRPSSALKELLENAIDAGSKNILVTVKDGGLKLLQITDDGCGIHKDDLPILCHRHTTSKLAKYEDLSSIGTLGFRGEALCSISFVSRLTITTMRQDAAHAWKAAFRDSEIVPPGAQPTAGVPGTAIVVEDLFYNIPTRRRTMGSSHDEYNRIFDVVAKYAIYSNGVGVSLKRHKEVRADIHTSPTFSRLECIRAIYGSALAAHLLPIMAKINWPGFQRSCEAKTPDEVSFCLEGYVVDADHALRKSTMLLFINGRAVDCQPLKRAVEAAYTSLISKTYRFWAFFDLQMPPAHLDVNIHPTKSEVAFLHQSEVIEAVRVSVEDLIRSRNDARTFGKSAQSALNRLATLPEANAEDDGTVSATTQRAKAGGDHKLVRTDHRSTSLQPFLVSNPTTNAAIDAATAGGVGVKRARATKRKTDVLALDDEAPENVSGLIKQLSNPPLADVPTIEALVLEIDRAAHTALTVIFREHTYVGHVERGLILLQHSTRLYIVDMVAISHDLMYQQALCRFGQFKSIKLSPRVNIRDAVMIGLDGKEAAGSWAPEDGPKETLADMIVELLVAKSSLLHECFTITVDEQGHLETLPQLIENFCPDLTYLPHFLLALAADVDWSDEQQCFRTLADALAHFYSIKPAEQQCSSEGDNDAAQGALPDQNQQWLIQHVILPAAKQHLKVPCSRAKDGSVVQIAALEQLYKVFERC